MFRTMLNLLVAAGLMTLFAGGCPAPGPDLGDPNSVPDAGMDGMDGMGGDAQGDSLFMIPLDESTARVSVSLPTGSTATGLIGWSGLGEAAVGSDGIDLPVFDSGPQLGAVFDDAGQVMLLGWIDPAAGRSEISARTTAEVMAYFDLGGWLLPASLRADLVAQLASEPAVDELAGEIETLLAEPGSTLTSVREKLNAPRDALAERLLADKTGTGGLRVDPANPQSGIRLNQPGLNTLVLTNTYRRRAVAFIERLTPDRAEVRQIKLSPTVGATSVTNILADLAQGNVAYAPVDSEEIPLELVPESAEETDYLVTVVGMGARLGAVEELTAAQTGVLGETIGQTLILDFFIPLLANTVVPLGGDQISRMLELPNADALVSSYLTAISSSAPNVMARARNGELRGALGELANAFATDGTVRLLTFDLLLNLFRSFTTPDERANFIDRANGVNQILGRFDAGLTAIDSATQVVQIGSSALAETWDVTVNRSRVRLTPGQADIVFGEQPTFTASVPDATGDNAAAITWHWSVPGTFGTLRSGFGQTGTSFDSSRDTVTYILNGREEGETSVTVEAFEVVGSERRSLGTATARIRIRELRPTLLPRRVALGLGDVETFRVEIPEQLGSADETYSYIWRTSGQFGGFRSGVADVEVPEDVQPWHCRSDEEGSDTVSCEVLVMRDGQQVSLGEATAEVQIEQGTRRSIIFGSFEIRQWTTSDGGACCQAGWVIPKVAGAARYDIYGYNFNDTAFYGRSNTDFIVEGSPRARDGGGKNTPQIDEGGHYYQGLSGGCSASGDIDGTCAWLESRFNGIIVEITVTYED